MSNKLFPKIIKLVNVKNVFGQYDAMKKGYIINYGEERMRGLQSTGGAFIKHRITATEIYQEITM